MRLSQLARVKQLPDGRAEDVSFIDIKKAYSKSSPKRKLFPAERSCKAKPKAVEGSKKKLFSVGVSAVT